ncbi:MAG: hypothetical protein ABEH65_00365 [Halobacteriales archaeon]
MSASEKSGGEVSTGENVFVIPISDDASEDYEHTVMTPLDLDELADRPEALDSMGEVRLWGVRTDTNPEQLFEKIQPGDLLVFYRDGTYIGVGTVGITFEDAADWTGETLWDGGSARYLYTVESFRSINVPRGAINRIFDYSTSYTPPRPMRVAEDRVSAKIRSIHLAIMRFDDKYGAGAD